MTKDVSDNVIVPSARLLIILAYGKTILFYQPPRGRKEASMRLVIRACVTTLPAIQDRLAKAGIAWTTTKTRWPECEIVEVNAEALPVISDLVDPHCISIKGPISPSIWKMPPELCNLIGLVGITKAMTIPITQDDGLLARHILSAASQGMLAMPVTLLSCEAPKPELSLV